MVTLVKWTLAGLRARSRDRSAVRATRTFKLSGSPAHRNMWTVKDVFIVLWMYVYVRKQVDKLH